MSEQVKPVTGYVKGERYQVTYEKTPDGGATIKQLELLGDIYTPAGAGFQAPSGHTPQRALVIVRRQPNGLFAVVRADTGEPVTATMAGIDFTEACTLGARQVAAAVLRDKQQNK